MEWEGIAVSTDFIIVILPALDKCREDQLTALCRIRSTMEVKRSLFLRPKCSGRPKYFPTPPSFVIPRIIFVLSLVLIGVFDEKELGVDWQKIIVSSANSRWLVESGENACREETLDLFHHCWPNNFPISLKKACRKPIWPWCLVCIDGKRCFLYFCSCRIPDHTFIHRCCNTRFKGFVDCCFSIIRV
ncbi:unnamed protein product [Brassica rapa subsp. trilocularis]